MLFSIIIPVYNGEQTIERTLNSILELQTKRTDIELIIVNDKSTDNTPFILKKYENFNNIKIINLPRQVTTGKCRNIGMLNATGKYIGFCDADDKYYIQTAIKIIQKMEHSKAEIGMATYKKYDLKTKEIREKNCNLLFSDLTKPKTVETISILNQLPDISVNCWSKIFRTEFLIENNIEFPDLSYAEDLAFTLKALFLSNKIVVCNDNLNLYTMPNSNPTSNDMMSVIRWRELIEALFISWNELKTLKEKTDKDIFESIYNSFVSDCIKHISYAKSKFKEINADFNETSLNFLCQLEKEYKILKS